MRIALIYLGRRGSGSPISLELATQLAHKTSLFAVISKQVENYPRWREANIPRIETDTYHNFGGAVISWLTQWKIYTLARQIRARKPDILLIPMFHTWTPFIQWYLRDIPCVFTVHDPAPHPGIFDWLDGRFKNFSIRQATRCIILSEKLQDTLVARGVPPESIDVVPHGELSYYQRLAASTKPTSAPQTTTLLFFGRITAYKGIEILIQAFRLLNPPNTVKLQIVGAGDFSPYISLLKGLENVEVVNHWIAEDKIAGFFQNASIVVLPYTSASQSGVLPVAGSFRLPVIVTHVGGLSEQVIHGETGLLVPARSPHALAAAIQNLLETPELARQLGENLHAEQQRENSWEKVAALTYAVCEKAVGGQRIR